ncbi:unnamed protein product, partial [marine sediment metagenome]
NLELQHRLIVLDINGVFCYRYFIRNIPEDKKALLKTFDNLEYIFIGDFIVYFRPYWRDFLEFCFKFGTVGFYSSTGSANVRKILEVLLQGQKRKAKFSWFRECR